MDRPRVQIHVQGAVRPETTSSRDLATLIRAIEVAVVEAAREQGIDVPYDGAVVSLVSIEAGSNRLRLAVMGAALVALSSITRALCDGQHDRLAPRSRKALTEMSELATNRNWVVAFERDEALGIEPATISVDKPVMAAQRIQVKGPTTIYGTCTRAGGAEPTVCVSLDGGGSVVVRVPREVAQRYAARLYQVVAMDGSATWDVADWTMVSFTFDREVPYRPSDPVRAFERLRAASGGVWDGVDVGRALADLRGEGEDGA